MYRHFSLLGQYLLQYTKVRLSYRADFLLSLITMVAATCFGVAVVFLIFGRVPRLQGWSFYEILFLYAFSLLPMSLFNMISINIYYFSDTYIVQGKFDRVLLRPLHSLFQILFEQFRLEAAGDIVLGIFLLVVCSRKLGFVLSPLEWLFIVGAAICGAVIYTSIFVMLASVSFWMEDRVGVIPPVYNMMAFGRYPLDIYSVPVRFILSWVVPFGFATFYPSAHLLREGAYRVYVVLLPVMATLFLGLALTVWNRGVRNYSSTGS